MEKLYTGAGRSLPAVPWERYPRPQMVRKEWLCLNGDWTLRFGEKETHICVPFCPESLLSGVPQPPAIGQQMIYHRAFTVPESWYGRRILLHFGAVNRDAVVSVNCREVARHNKGYLPFSADVTDALHEAFGFRTDYEIVTNRQMGKVLTAAHSAKVKKVPKDESK